MSAVLDQVALAITAAGIVAAVLVAASTRRPAQALPALLEFLLAAGLLRLVGDPTWQRVVTTAAIAVLRRLVGRGLRYGAAAWTTAGASAWAAPAWTRPVPDRRSADGHGDDEHRAEPGGR